MSNGTPIAPSRYDTALDTSRPHPARRYDYLLGGKDNFPADRHSGDALIAAFPHVQTAAILNRRFLQRGCSSSGGNA